MMTFDLNQLSQTLGTAYGLIGLFIFIWTLIVTTWALFKLPSLTSALKELPPLIIRLEKVVDGLKPTIDQVTSAVSNSTKDIEQVAKQIDAVSVQLGKISDITRQRTDYEPAPQPSFEGQPPPEASAGEQQADDATVEDHWPT
jgi:hypothetical protein